MTKTAKVWLIVAVALVFLGSIFFVGVMSMSKWDFKKLSTVEYVTITYETNEDFNNIFLDTMTADIEFVISDNTKTVVECYDNKYVTHSVAVEDGVFKVKSIDNRKWYQHIGINMDSPKITVKLPKTDYASLIVNSTTSDVTIGEKFKFEKTEVLITTGDIKFEASVTDNIKLKTTTGDILLQNATAQEVDIKVTTGDVVLKNTQCRNLIINGTTGEARLTNVIAKEKIYVKRGSGDITLNDCDAKELSLNTTTGDITGSLLSDKVFTVKSTTGDINVPNTTNGGKCEINVTTGEVDIKLNNE